MVHAVTFRSIYDIFNFESFSFWKHHISRDSTIVLCVYLLLPPPQIWPLLQLLQLQWTLSLFQTQQNLLPAPYKSNCTDYLTEWKKNGGEGPVTMNVSIIFLFIILFIIIELLKLCRVFHWFLFIIRCALKSVSLTNPSLCMAVLILE